MLLTHSKETLTHERNVTLARPFFPQQHLDTRKKSHSCSALFSPRPQRLCNKEAGCKYQNIHANQKKPQRSCNKKAGGHTRPQRLCNKEAGGHTYQNNHATFPNNIWIHEKKRWSTMDGIKKIVKEKWHIISCKLPEFVQKCS